MKKLREKILDQVSEIQIFERYLGIQVKLGRAMVSPLRQEKHPSFNLYQSPSNGKIYYKDFGDERGDCFKLVMELYQCSFVEALQVVANDFGIDTSKKDDVGRLRQQAKKIRIPQFFVQPRKELPYARREWSEPFLTLWKKGHVNLNALREYEVYDVLKMKVPKREGDGFFIIESKETDPIYCYDYGDGVKKFYRPYAPDKKYKFISNLRRENIFGLKQLKDHVQKTGQKVRLIIICAGQKDCLSLYCNTGIRGLALNSESAGISNELYVELMQYAEHILVCYDSDDTGRKHAQKIKDEIGIEYMSLEDLAPADIVKDIFDYFAKDFSVEQFLQLTEQSIC